MEQKFGAVIVAAGSGTRMGLEKNKVLLPLGGQPVLLRSLRAALACPYVGAAALVCRAQDRKEIEALLPALDKPLVLTEGGPERQDSVARGVAALGGDYGYVLVHDAARPLASTALFSRVCEQALRSGAASAALLCKDTVKLARDGLVEQSLPRERLFAVQTPQAFERKLYLRALEQARAAGLHCTDDCQLLERAGIPVSLCPGEEENQKLTTAADLRLLAALSGEEAQSMRIGYGYDVHRLVPDRKLILGGVEIPFEMGLLGHSDADVLTHAIADALLGAAALGDIGQLFPDTDPAYAGADSLVLLAKVCALLRGAGYAIGNIDATLIAQRPKIAPYVPAMREKLAAACGVDTARVSVKATTEEGLGFTGTGEGMAASAVCLLQ